MLEKETTRGASRYEELQSPVGLRGNVVARITFVLHAVYFSAHPTGQRSTEILSNNHLKQAC